MNRSVVAVLALMSACGISAAVADSPPTPGATPATAAPATPVTAPTPAVSPPATQDAAATATATAKPTESAAKATEAAQEKLLLDAGWRPEMQHGQKVWCRREEVLGSRIEGRRVCGTADQINLVGRRTEQDIGEAQKKLNTYPVQ